MPTFDYSFDVAASAQAVAEFHDDTRVLRRLTPAYVQIHRVDPLADGSIAEFTVWFGPMPIRWRALHRDVGPRGFTDVQEAGPLRSWVHTHRFEPTGDHTTRVREHVEYEHESGWHGVQTRVLFGAPALRALFAYRAWRTRRALRG
ncbi:MAG: SRPBCC family protein [Acidimicrobiia bacterium]|nr:SRPBCC family protein [Acidimicrobiia bacterium]